MIKIGITGGIGAGKSLVCEVFKALGIPVFNADYEAKHIIATDKTLRESFISHFGSDIYFTDGTLNKTVLAHIIFNNADELRYVNSIVHPLVFDAFNKWSLQFRDKEYLLHESAILFESGANKHVDKTIAVTAPLELRIKRIMQRDGVQQNEIEARMRNQWEQSRIAGLADMEIINDEKKLIIPQILEIHNKITKQFN